MDEVRLYLLPALVSIQSPGEIYMRLDSFAYSEYPDSDAAWCIEDCTFGNINLIVGMNASGKSRVVSVIKALAGLLTGRLKLLGTGNWTAVFDGDTAPQEYRLEIENYEVRREEFIVHQQVMLKRGAKGTGQIWAEQLRQDIEFQTPVGEISAVNRRDSIQHPFFESLHQWASNQRFYSFGSTLGKDNYALFVKGGPGILELDLVDDKQVVALFREGSVQHEDVFKQSILADMKRIGYDLEDVGICLPDVIKVDGSLNGEIRGIYVRERGVKVPIQQFSISQGMFRALSLIIQLNFALKKGVPSCIIIDDIGEGLDFERSTSLIKLLVERAESSAVQLIMTTNDRFVMNAVPLKYWSVIVRRGQVVRLYNIRNSSKTFEEFESTGLNNFDFFSTNFFEEGLKEE